MSSDKENEMGSEYKETWFIVPSRILELKGLTLGYLKVYETIFQFWNKKQPCFLSNSSIKIRTNVCGTDIKKALNFFEKAGELQRVQKGLRRFLTEPSRSIEIQEDATASCSTEFTQEDAIASGGGRYSVQGGVAIASTEIKNLNKETNLSLGHSTNDRDRDSVKSQLQKTSSTHTESFEKFWDAYPIKIAKQSAFKAWVKLNPDEILALAIFVNVQLRIEKDDEWIEGYAPRPTRYINERRWEDGLRNKEQDKIKCKERKKQEAYKVAKHKRAMEDEERRNNEAKQTDAKAYQNLQVRSEGIANLKKILGK